MDLKVGSKLRTIRLAQGKSLRSVATGVGISPSLLSQVENAKTSPSVSTLYALVSYLGVTLDALLPSESLTRGMDEWGMVKSNDVVQSRRDNQRLEMQNGVVWERLADKANTLVDPLIVTYDPGAGSSVDGTSMQHNASEFGLLLEGNLTLNLDGKTYQISAGDSFSFDARIPHRYVNNGNEVARGVWFVVSEDVTHKPQPTKTRKNGVQPESAVEVLAMMGNKKKSFK